MAQKPVTIKLIQAFNYSAKLGNQMPSKSIF